MAKCPACKKDIFGYNWSITKNGKKWLRNAEGQWHDCPNSQRKTYENTTGSLNGKFSQSDFVICKYCGHCLYKQHVFERYPQLVGVHKTLEQHIEAWHPNGEILDKYDFMCLSDENKNKLRVEHGVVKRSSFYS